MSKTKTGNTAIRIETCKFDIKVKYIRYGWMRMNFKFNDFIIDFTADTSFNSPLADLVSAVLDLENYKDANNEVQVVFEDSLEKLYIDLSWASNNEDVNLQVTREYEETIDENNDIHPASKEQWNYIMAFGCLKVEVLYLCATLLRTYGLLGVNSNMGRDSFPIDGFLRLCQNQIHITEKGGSKYSDFYEDIKLLKKIISRMDETDDWCRREFPKIVL